MAGTAARPTGATAFVVPRLESELPAEEIFCGDEVCYACCFACQAVHFLIADHRRRCQVDAVHICQLRDHSALRLAACAVVGVGMRAYLPRGEDVAEHVVELRERGFYLCRGQTASADSRLIRYHKHQMVVHGPQLFGHAGQELDDDVAVGVERNLARLVQLDQGAAEIEKQRGVAIRIGHRKDFAYAWRQSTWSRTCANTSSRIAMP